MNELKTPLFAMHEKYGGKIVPFAGYLLPVQYSGIIAEHLAVREKAGIFDVSHMGEFLFEGKDALKNINYLFTNDFTNMELGQVRYSPMCYENGGVVDDLIVYKMGDEKYFVVVNASNKDKDATHIKKHLFGDVKFSDISSETAQIAIQGPKSAEILEKVANKNDIPQRYYRFCEDVLIDSCKTLISKTGYTGEDGYEIYCEPKDAEKIWEILLLAGKDEGLIPCGLGSRDTLRLEAAMPLYGHELSAEITPIEAGLKFFVKLEKDDFIGKSALLDKGEPTKKRVGLQITDRGIVREYEKVFVGEKQIGETTSGTHCPVIKKAVAMAYLDVAYCEIGTSVEVLVRGKKIKAEVTALPFYKRVEKK